MEIFDFLCSIEEFNKYKESICWEIAFKNYSSTFDLSQSEKIAGSPYYVVALAIIQSIILKLISQNHVRILEIDPPYEKYEWIGN